MLNIVISLRTGIHSSNISLQMDERFLRKLFCNACERFAFLLQQKEVLCYDAAEWFTLEEIHEF